MKNLILEEMDRYDADGVDFVPIFDLSKIPPIICSYTREELKNLKVYPKSDRKYWKMINGKKVYCDKNIQKLIEERENKMMSSEKFIGLCKQKVAEYFNENSDVTGKANMKPDDVYVVWYCKTLQNHKALLSTPVSDGMYYEIAYNGDKHELYLDAYKKWKNIKYEV